ncbi:MAG: oxidoreductase [Acidobacteriota bacterium]
MTTGTGAGRERGRGGLSRRELLAAGVALGTTVAPRAVRVAAPRRSALVVGAGAFGGWSALHLLRRGFEVTLVDAWGPGNSRASSGGETRVIRGSYGARGVYTRLTARAFELWKEHDAARGSRLFHPVGVLWMHGADDSFLRESIPHLDASGLRHERLDARAAAARWPQIDWRGLAGALWEPDSGYLDARRACADVVAAFTAAGGRFVLDGARPVVARGEAAVELDGGGRLAADHIVFACGPWLSRLFPDVIGVRIRPTRQEVFFFGTPAGEPRFAPPQMPVWADPSGERMFYGIPGNDARGFKVADDTRGEPIDPTTLERTPSPAALERARAFLARRFPALAGAPLVEARVCQYENSPDGDLIFDRHPEAANLWLLGGGSGHGFKLGPALGEHVAGVVAGETAPEPAFGLARFAKPES